VSARRASLALVFPLAVFLAACGGDDPGFETVEIPPGEPVVIGVSTMLEGDLASTGEALRDAAALAGEGVTIAGHEVEFVATDDACTVEGGSAAAEELVATEHLVAVVGPSCSDAVLGSQPVFEQAGITHISQLSTNILTTAPEDRDPYRTFLRTVFNDEIQGQQQAAFAEQELGADTAFIVYEAFRYGGAADEFRETFSGELVGDVGFEDEADFPDIVSQITEAGPDLVYYSGFYPTGIPFVQALRDGGYAGPVLAGDAMYDQAMIDGLGELAEQELYVTLPSPPLQGAEFEDFSSSYQEAYGADPTATSFTAESFDAASAIILGLQADGVVEETDGGVEVDLEALNDAIHEISFDGASGPVRFDDKGDRVAEGLTPVTVFVVRDGVFVPADGS
jgi:branched-chain amino acid transport system substrate-binding protein